MPHIDEGQIHALLDGAYRHDSSEAVSMHAHIAACMDCRALLDAERDVRDRAHELLDRARPLPEVIPPFETIVARSKASRKPMWLPPASLAWAATLIMALGTGWFGRDLVSRRTDQMVAPDEQSASPIELAAPQTPAPPTQPPTEPSAGRGAVQSPPPSVPAPQTLDERGRMASEAQKRTTGESAARVEADLSASTKVAATAPPAAARAAARDAAAGAVSGFAAESQSGQSWQEVTLDAAERTIGRRVLLLPGLELVKLELRALSDGFAVRAAQRIPNDGTVELVQEPVAVIQVQERAMAQAAGNRALRQEMRTAETAGNSVTIETNGLRVTARAAISADSLRVLLSKLR